MTCANCESVIDELPYTVSIWVEVMGDEYGFGYVACKACGYYTESCTRDGITAGEFDYSPRAISKERGEQIVRLIGACPERSDKRCECPVHEKFRRSPPPSSAGFAW